MVNDLHFRGLVAAQQSLEERFAEQRKTVARLQTETRVLLCAIIVVLVWGRR